MKFIVTFFLAMGFSTLCFADLCGPTLTSVSIKSAEAQYWVAQGNHNFKRDTIIEGASLEAVIDALQNVDPRRVAPRMEIVDLPSPSGPRVQNFLLKVANPFHWTLKYFGLAKFLVGSDPLTFLGSEIRMTLISNGFRLDATGPIVNGTDLIVATQVGQYVIVRESGSLGGAIQNRGHVLAFDLAPELKRLLGSE